MVNIVVRPLRARFLLLASAFGAVVLVLSLLVPSSAYAETPEPPETVAPASYLNPDGSPAPDPNRPDIPQEVQDAEAIANGEGELQIQTRSLNAVSSRPVFNPGRIIDDEVFFNHNTMTAAQIQTFLNQRLSGGCLPTENCLRNYKQTTKSIPADRFCGAYQGTANESAATIIYKVAKACKVNPQVLLVTMQKEQSLVTLKNPSNGRYNAAMGMACPDTSPCDPAYANFFGQIYGGARQFQVYANDTAYFSWYPVGQRSTIYYNFDRSCGSTSVLIENKATAGLYYYTPYQPNAAALAAGYGSGDRCSAYGNRDFFFLFNDWFGSTLVGGTPTTPAPVCPVPKAADLRYTSKTLKTTGEVNFRRGPSTDCESMGMLSINTVVTETATFNGWSRVSNAGKEGWIRSDLLVTAPNGGPYEIDRIAGNDRYATAAFASKEAFPSWSSADKSVYLVSGWSFPDAISGASLASAKGKPLLMTMADSIPAVTLAELKRLQPQRIVLVGGTGVISAKVESALKAHGAIVTGKSLVVDRRAGADRYQTNQILLGQELGMLPEVFVATGQDYADALTAAAASGVKNAPVLLIDGRLDGISADVRKLLREKKVKKATVVGGTGVITAKAAAQIEAVAGDAPRASGADRYATSFELNRLVFPKAPAKVFIASGLNYADSISGAVLAGTQNAPLYTQPATCILKPLREHLAAGVTKTLGLIGGHAVLNDAVGLAKQC